MLPEGKTKRAFMTLLDCLAASDGGLSLLRFRELLENLDKAVEANDDQSEAAKTILKSVYATATLIRLAHGEEIHSDDRA